MDSRLQQHQHICDDQSGVEDTGRSPQKHRHRWASLMRIPKIRNCASEIRCRHQHNLSDSISPVLSSPIVTEANIPERNLSTRNPPRFFTRAVPTKNNKKIPYETI